MHIMEGYLPVEHAVGWSLAALPFVLWGVRSVTRQTRDNPEAKLLLGAAGGFCFLLSALKLPSLTGSSSHATGASLGTFLLGAPGMALLGTLVLLFQAVLLAHGGLTTLGANVFSMAVVGPWTACLAFRGLRCVRVPAATAVFLSAALADLATYATTAGQLALAFPDARSGFLGAFAKFLLVFAVTQLPLAIVEGALTAVVFRTLCQHVPVLIGGRPAVDLVPKRRSPEAWR